MYGIFRYKMAESCVQEIRLPEPKLVSFFREVESKHGVSVRLSELYTRDHKLGNEIIFVRFLKLRLFEMLWVIFGSKEQEVRFKSSGMLCAVSCYLVTSVWKAPGFLNNQDGITS
jgi:hypothetical protein